MYSSVVQVRALNSDIATIIEFMRQRGIEPSSKAAVVAYAVEFTAAAVSNWVSVESPADTIKSVPKNRRRSHLDESGGVAARELVYTTEALRVKLLELVIAGKANLSSEQVTKMSREELLEQLKKTLTFAK